jgi:hypothetical protein
LLGFNPGSLVPHARNRAQYGIVCRQGNAAFCLCGEHPTNSILKFTANAVSSRQEKQMGLKIAIMGVGALRGYAGAYGYSHLIYHPAGIATNVQRVCKPLASRRRRRKSMVVKMRLEICRVARNARQWQAPSPNAFTRSGFINPLSNS